MTDTPDENVVPQENVPTEATPVEEQTPVVEAMPAPPEEIRVEVDASQEDQPTEEKREQYKPPRFSVNVTIEREVTGKMDKDSEYYSPIPLLNVRSDDLNKLVADYPKLDFKNDAAGRRWLATFEEARESAMVGKPFENSLDREGGEWTQSVTHEAVRLAPGRPALGSGDGSGKLTGQAAVLRMQAALGIGSMVYVPLWHSGIWVNINAPSDVKLLNLERRIADEKITLGRMTNGLIFSHSSVYIVEHLMALLMDSIQDVNMKDYSADKLLDLVKVTDLPVLAWGLACSIYPNGYDISHPCVNNPDKCKHITKERINLARLFFFDHKGITHDQRKHMGNRQKKYTLEEIQHYQTLGRGGDGRTVEISEDITLVLKVPTIRDYIRSGHKWIESIEEMISTAMSGRPTDKDKNEYVTQQSIVTIFRQYAHWVSKIVFRGNEEVLDTETIEEVLSLLSSDQKLYEKFFDSIKAYIDDSTVALIALPSFVCPACDEPMTTEESKHPNLIPLDPVNLFFTLVHRRLDRTRIN